MPRFFVTNTQISNGTVTVTGADAHHISRALRMAVGDVITVADSRQIEYECRLVQFLEDAVIAEILSEKQQDTESPVRVTLYQALPKGDKLDTVIQKAVECGAVRVVPFESERCVVRVKPETEARKTERRARIALEAAKQCGRGVIPEVLPTVSFDEMLAMAAAAELPLFCFEGEGTVPIGQILQGRRDVRERAVIVGSEGGFSLAEAEKAREQGLLPTGLGKRILRTETAPLFALSCISCLFELT